MKKITCFLVLTLILYSCSQSKQSSSFEKTDKGVIIKRTWCWTVDEDREYERWKTNETIKKEMKERNNLQKGEIYDF